MQRQLPIAGLGPALVVVLGAATLLLNLGYTFELNDQLQYLLLPYRTIYLDFALGDWFTWKTSHYHISFAWLVRGLHALVGTAALPQAIFAVHAATLAWLCAAILHLSRALGTGTLGAVVSIGVIALVRHEGMAGATFNHGQLVPADLALPPLLLAAVAWVLGKPRRAGLWLGLAGLLHSNYAILGPLLLGLAELMAAVAHPGGRRQAITNLAKMAMVYTPIALPSLWLIGNEFALGDSAPAAVRTVFEIRSPHHYDLGAMERADMWWIGLLLAAALPALGQRVDQHATTEMRARYLLRATATWLFVAAAGSFLVIDTVVRLFFWRLSPVLILLLLMYSVRFWNRLASSERPTMSQAVRSSKALWALTALFGLCAFGRSDMALVGAFGAPPSTFALGSVLLVGLAGVLASARRSAPLAVVALLAALGAAQVVTAGPVGHERVGAIRKPTMRGPRLGRFVFGSEHKHVKQQALVEWVKMFTPSGTSFLIPPSLISFRLRTQRAVFVDFKAAPMRGQEVLEWKRRMLLAMGTEDFPTRGYRLRYLAGFLFERRPLRELAELAMREHLDMIITLPKAGAKKAGLTHVATVDGYAIYRPTAKAHKSR